MSQRQPSQAGLCPGECHRAYCTGVPAERRYTRGQGVLYCAKGVCKSMERCDPPEETGVYYLSAGQVGAPACPGRCPPQMQKTNSPFPFSLVLLSRWLFLLVWCLGLWACQETPSAPLRLGTNVWPGYEPLYLARDLGYIEARTVTLVEYRSASEVIRALRNHTLEAGALTLDEVLLLQQQRIPVHVILIMDISHGADSIVAPPAVSRLADLVGKRIGVETSALGAYVLARALERFGLGLADLTVVPVEVSKHVAAYQEGQVDAVVTFEPARTQLLTLGAREVFSSRDIPGEIVDVLAIRRDALRTHARQIRQVVQSWFRALNYLAQQPTEAAARMQKRLRLDPAAILRSYEDLTLPGRAENVRLLGGQGVPQILDVAQRLREVMLARQLLRTPVDLDGLFLPIALPEDNL